MSSRSLSVWRRLFGRFKRDSEAPLALPHAATAEPAVLGSEEEAWLSELITAVGEGRRLEEIGDADFWKRVDGLWEHGDELLAAQWISKFIAAPATPAGKSESLRLRLVEMYHERGNLGPVVEQLETLAESEEHALQAHYLLAEHHRHRGDEPQALRHYEAVLARDVDYPNVRQRVERLRVLRGGSAPARAGDTIAGVNAVGGSSGSRYVLVRELGRGASGVVYLARDSELDREVAVKLLHPHLAAANRAGACARFFAEARLAASLRHPNIVAILDLDEAARRIVMELAAGGTLRQLLLDRGPRSIRRALEYHVQILSALQAAHSQGVIHRDLKPANLMFRRDPDEAGAEIVLGDFGVAHLPDARSDQRARRTSERRDLVGTLAYMAPEQRRGRAEPRSDLFAAAVVAYEMLTASYPWPRSRLLAGERRRDDFRLPTSIVPADLRGALDQHLEAIGAPDAEARPDTGEALRQALALRDQALIATAGEAS